VNDPVAAGRELAVVEAIVVRDEIRVVAFLRPRALVMDEAVPAGREPAGVQAVVVWVLVAVVTGFVAIEVAVAASRYRRRFAAACHRAA
jgi:hypothetical protein